MLGIQKILSKKIFHIGDGVIIIQGYFICVCKNNPLTSSLFKNSKDISELSHLKGTQECVLEFTVNILLVIWTCYGLVTDLFLI